METEELTRRFKEINLERFIALEDAPPILPHIWKWKEVAPALGMTLDALKQYRASPSLVNPGRQVCKRFSERSTTRTFRVEFQVARRGGLGGPFHRHNFMNVFLLIKGQGAFGWVDGRKVAMEAGDVLFVPPMAWHGLGTDGDDAIWLGCANVTLMDALDILFVEPYPRQPEMTQSSTYKVSPHRPTWPGFIAPLLFKGEEAYRAVKSLGGTSGDSFDGIALEYIPPVDETQAWFPLSCCIHLLRPGETTETHRHTSSTVLHVLKGSGMSVVDEHDFKWEQGDCLVIPALSWHCQRNLSQQEEALLFSCSDVPIMKALRLYQEEKGRP